MLLVCLFDDLGKCVSINDSGKCAHVATQPVPLERPKTGLGLISFIGIQWQTFFPFIAAGSGCFSDASSRSIHLLVPNAASQTFSLHSSVPLVLLLLACIVLIFFMLTLCAKLLHWLLAAPARVTQEKS